MRAIIIGATLVLTFGLIAATSHTSSLTPATLAQQDQGVRDPNTGSTPEPPRAFVDLAINPQSTRRIHVAAGGDLQAALDRAEPGDRIELDNGAMYKGPFHLRRKAGDGWIVVTSVAADSFVQTGTRIDPSQSSRMAKLVASSESVIEADPGAHHYRFVGIEIAPTEGTFLNTLVQLGDEESKIDRLPHHIIFDRCYLHGDPRKGTRRGIALNSRQSAVINSYLADFKEVGADSQAIAGWNGPGPFTISNNYLEAAGENVMFGGADPSIHGLVPADIQITHNHLAKPLSWRKDDPSFEGTLWTVKNLFELKNARRVVIDGNLLEHNWPESQNGFAVLLTVRNQDGTASWSVVEDVVFSNNVVRHAAAGINILGRDDVHSSERTRRVAIHGNLFLDIGGQWGSGRLFQLLDGTRDVVISHNTAFQTGAAVFGGDNDPHIGFVFENNVVLHNEFGIGGSGTGIGRPSLARYFPGSVVRGNVLVGGNARIYPDNNLFPATAEAAGFAKGPNGASEAVRVRRPAGTNEHVDAGADIEELSLTVARVSSGRDDANATAERTSEVNQAGVLGPSRVAGDSEELLFWGSLVLLAYTYAGYPLVALMRSRWWPKRHRRAPGEPTVSIVVAAHNEAACIEARIENLLALDYPADRLQIIVGSDGSTDDTANRASRFVEAGVRVHVFRRWRGKAAVLNRLVMSASGEIVLFADARQRFDAGVVKELVSHFADPTVGAVSGELMLSANNTGTSVGRGTSFYWRYEKFIRFHEGRAASTVGATGAIYAIRRSLFEPIPTDTILDDVLIPLRIVRKGYFVQFEPRARAFQAVSADAQQECVRKRRTIAGMFQLFARERWLLNPRQNPLWFETISHKGLRLVLPALHAVLFATSMALTDGFVYLTALVAQVGFYAAAATGHVFRKVRRPIVLTVPYAMCLMLWATIVGFARFITDRQRVTWEQSSMAVPRSSAPAR